MAIDNKLEEMLTEESPTSAAVKSLINVKDRVSGKDSEIELKTDLDIEQVNVHTIVDLCMGFLEMDEKDFKKNIVGVNLVNKKERKLLSKNRMSRAEIVQVARQPDLNMLPEQHNEGFLKRFFTSRRKV